MLCHQTVCYTQKIFPKRRPRAITTGKTIWNTMCRSIPLQVIGDVSYEEAAGLGKSLARLESTQVATLLSGTDKPSKGWLLGSFFQLSTGRLKNCARQTLREDFYTEANQRCILLIKGAFRTGIMKAEAREGFWLNNTYLEHLIWCRRFCDLGGVNFEYWECYNLQQVLCLHAL